MEYPSEAPEFNHIFEWGSWFSIYEVFC
jgi:hypothetical protein